jgi:hypothetical protein
MAQEVWAFGQVLNPEAMWLDATRIEPPMLFWQLLFALQLLVVVALLSLDDSALFGTLLEMASQLLLASAQVALLILAKWCSSLAALT